MLFGACAFPFVVALYGWSAQLVLPTPIMLSSVMLLGFVLMPTMLPMTAYIVDAFNLYSASSLTAVLISRCLMGTFLPLITAPLKESIGYGWGFMVLAATCAVLAPVPIAVWRYGERWRQSSGYTRDL